MLSDDPTPPPRPQGRYRTARSDGRLLVSAGMTPRVDGRLRHTGRVGDTVTVEDAAMAAGIAVGNAVAAIAELAGSVEAIGAAVRMTVYVNATDDFVDHTKVADGASARLLDLLGQERGSVARTAVGVASLPGGACVEVELTCSR